MTYRSFLIWTGMVILSAAGVQRAGADTYAVTYTGLASGTDTYGIFGAAGAILSNVAFSSTYTYDPTQFGNATQRSSSTYIEVYGGYDYGSIADPLLSAAVTINGSTYSNLLGNQGTQFIRTSAPLIQYVAGSYYATLANYAYPTTSPALSFAASQAFASSGGASGYFSYESETINLTSSAVSISDESATSVPEPGSFALFAAAFALFVAVLGAWHRTVRTRVSC